MATKTYTYSQLANAKLDDLRNDSDMLVAFGKLYSPTVDPNKLLNYWTTGYRNFSSDKSYALGSVELKGGNETARSVDRYINWNNPANPKDQAAAFKEREKALVGLEAHRKAYADLGIDITDASWYKQFVNQLGATPGGGQTSAQTAGIIDSQVKSAGGISTKADGTKTDLKTGNVTSADGKTITVNGVKYVNDPSNTALQKALQTQSGSAQLPTVQPTQSQGMWADAKTAQTVQPTTPNTQGVNAWASQGQSVTPTTGTQSYNVKGVEELYAKILSGELKPSKDNQAWTALYKDGKATPEQVEAYRRYSAMSDEATKLFEQIKAGTLKPSKTDPTWASMYKDGQATEAQKKAYAMWQEFTNKALSNTSNIKTAQDANNAVNQWQAGQFMASEDSEDVGMVKDYGEMTSKDLLSDLIGSTEAMPEAPSTMKQLTELRAEYGMDDMETEINNIKAEMEEIDAIKRERQFNQEGKRTSMGVIAGRVSEIERQENERLDALSRQLNAKVNAYESKLSVVNMMMSASQTDYQNAMSEYQTKFSQKMTLINAIKGYEDAEKAEQEAEIDNARANLQIALESLQGSGYDSLSEVQKMTLESLSTKAGVPSALLPSLLKETNENKVLAQMQREDINGASYIDLVMQDPKTGEIYTKSLQLSGPQYLDSGSSSAPISGSSLIDQIPTELKNIPKSGSKTTNALGTGIITGYGSSYWEAGLDFVLEGGMGAKVPAPVSGKVVQVDTGHVKGEKNSFGNRVKIEMDNGEQIWLSHLQSTNVEVGQQVNVGDIIGAQGNTGTVAGKTGIHLDVTMTKNGGGYYTAKEVQAFLQAAEKAKNSAPITLDANTIISRLPKEKADRAYQLFDDFKAEPIVKAYNEAVTNFNTIAPMLEDFTSGKGTSDITMIYSFMKALDPTSVVRETEFESVAKAGNIFSGSLEKYNKYLGKGGFLPPEVRNELYNFINSKISSNAKQYENLRGQYVNTINRFVGYDIGDEVLLNYGAPQTLGQQKSTYNWGTATGSIGPTTTSSSQNTPPSTSSSEIDDVWDSSSDDFSGFSASDRNLFNNLF